MKKIFFLIAIASAFACGVWLQSDNIPVSELTMDNVEALTKVDFVITCEKGEGVCWKANDILMKCPNGASYYECEFSGSVSDECRKPVPC